jgi:uncharacterized protein (TIGR02646 family)
MIRLTRPAIPTGHADRAARGARELWNQWAKNRVTPGAKASIYAHSDVKKALRVDAQHNKCAYCETINPTSHDVVEHFRPKNGWRQKRGDPLTKPAYFWLSYEWENLLFACDRCNDAAHKENLFPLSNPSRRADAANPEVRNEIPLLINPYDVDPELHIEWNRDIPRPRNRSRKGSKSIEVLGLDHDDLLADERRKYFGTIERLITLVESYSPNNSTRQAVVKDLMFCLEDSAPWAAMIRSNFANRIRSL